MHAGSTHDEDEISKLGVRSDLVSPEVAFAKLVKIRQACRGAFAAGDCSLRVKRALLRKAAPMAGEYHVGGRLQGAGQCEGAKLSHASRVIDFDGDPNGAKTEWASCVGVPVCCS